MPDNPTSFNASSARDDPEGIELRLEGLEKAVCKEHLVFEALNTPKVLVTKGVISLCAMVTKGNLDRRNSMWAQKIIRDPKDGVPSLRSSTLDASLEPSKINDPVALTIACPGEEVDIEPSLIKLIYRWSDQVRGSKIKFAFKKLCSPDAEENVRDLWEEEQQRRLADTRAWRLEVGRLIEEMSEAAQQQ